MGDIFGLLDMGFYLRKSISFGPLRLNLSNSGMGISTGVKGFRIGTGPRGNYIHAGRGGLYYRATLPVRTTSALPPQPIPELVSNNPMVEIDSGSATNMIDENAIGLLTELREKHKLMRTWPFCAGATGLFFLLAMVSDSGKGWLIGLGLLFGILALIASWWDAQRKTTVLLYDMQLPVLPAFESFYTAFESLAASCASWHIAATSTSSDTKYTAGANILSRAKKIRLSAQAPDYVKVNIPIPYFNAGSQRLYFFPERLLVYDANDIGAVSYDTLELAVEERKNVETSGVPADARVIGQTWRYVNKKGGPDKRFRDNPELPLVLYEELKMQSSSGLNELFTFSMLGSAQQFMHALTDLKDSLGSQGALSPPLKRTRTNITGSDFIDAEPAAPPMLSDSGQGGANSTENAGNFYYHVDSVRGPVSVQDLLNLAEAGSITNETQICSETDQQWIPYGDWKHTP